MLKMSVISEQFLNYFYLTNIRSNFTVQFYLTLDNIYINSSVSNSDGTNENDFKSFVILSYTYNSLYFFQKSRFRVFLILNFERGESYLRHGLVDPLNYLALKPRHFTLRLVSKGSKSQVSSNIFYGNGFHFCFSEENLIFDFFFSIFAIDNFEGSEIEIQKDLVKYT